MRITGRNDNAGIMDLKVCGLSDRGYLPGCFTAPWLYFAINRSLCSRNLRSSTGYTELPEGHCRHRCLIWISSNSPEDPGTKFEPKQADPDLGKTPFLESCGAQGIATRYPNLPSFNPSLHERAAHKINRPTKQKSGDETRSGKE
ncbi:hypothetical protein KM043_009716 [Ampulex compressa]|nr:hypothetical protein KM043_009716 [Ampulex compressa]